MTGKRIVLTGGPASGKSAVIEALKSMGFNTVPEAALDVICEQEAAKTNIFPWTNPIVFQELTAKKQLDRENQLNGSTVILDRSLIEGHAFCKHFRTPVPLAAEDAIIAQLPRYDVVFLLEMLPPPYSEITGNGKPRMSTPKERKRLETLIIEEYEKRGYQLVRVPYMSILKRAQFILEKSGITPI